MNTLKKSVMLWLLLGLQFLVINQLHARINSPNPTHYTEAELAQILAPIALYPDSLLTHIVIASTYPLEIVQAQRWREDNSYLEAAQAVEKAEQQGWDPSVAALVAFPNVLERLSIDLAWTQRLGEAFLLDEEAVLDSIQDLRKQAERANALEEMENVRVIKVERQIIIEPVHQEVVYVPYYDTRSVYGNWRWHRYPPVYWDFRPHISIHYSNRFSSRFHWSAGININFNYFFGAFKWHNRQLVVTHHHHTRRYRSHKRIALSQGAKRWQHNSVHRRGVAYKAYNLNTRFKHDVKARRFDDRHRHHTIKKHLKEDRKHYHPNKEKGNHQHVRNAKSINKSHVDAHYKRDRKFNDHFSQHSNKQASKRIERELKARKNHYQDFDKSIKQKGKSDFRTKRSNYQTSSKQMGRVKSLEIPIQRNHLKDAKRRHKHVNKHNKSERVRLKHTSKKLDK